MSSQFLTYEFVKSNFHQKLDSLEHLNETLPKLYGEYFESESEKLKRISIQSKELEIINNVIDLIKKDNHDEMMKEVQKLSKDSLMVFKDVIHMVGQKHETNQFLQHMTISYLITVFEDFLNKTLRLVFYYKRETLKSANVLNYKTIIELKTYDAIIENMIQEKAKEIIDKPILELGKTLEKDFHFPLINDTNWAKFMEVFYRRHAIVHNNGWADEDYKIKTSNMTIENLTPTEDYIKNSINLFRQYSDKIYEFFKEKYPVTTA